MTDLFLEWLKEAGKHWDTVKPEDVLRELGREPESVRIQELEAQKGRAKKALLGRLAKAEAELKLSEEFDKDWEEASVKVRAQALTEMRERCAQVAERYEPQCESCPRGVASAIRALKLEDGT